MIRGIARLAVVGAGVSWALDRILADHAKGADPEPIRSMIVIEAPIERVWAEITDIAGQPRWMLDMKAVRVLTDGPIGVTTEAEADLRIFGVSVRDPITITEFEPPRRFALTHDGQFKGKGVITLEAGADGTTTIVRWEETIIPPVLPHLGALVQTPLLGSIFQADLVRLRDLIETGSTAS